MKALRISIAMLVLLVAVSLLNGACLTRRCDGWKAQLDAVTAAAGRDDWDTAQQEMAALHGSWQQRQGYLHIILQHEEINEADTLLHQCALYAAQQDAGQLSDAAVQLALQLDRLMEMEQLSIKNVL